MQIKAKESSQVAKARKKLEGQMAIENKLITTQALGNIRKSMHNWIARHHDERISLKEKTVTLFDENEHPAKPQNKFILSLLKNISTKSKKGRKIQSERISFKSR
jgi:hypothetical protein